MTAPRRLAGTVRRPSELVRLKKHVVTEQQQVTVPVQREEVRIEREPITDTNRDRAMDGPEITEAEHAVTLNQEEVVVDKQVVPKERVRLDKDVSTAEETVDETVRKERIDVERKSSAAPLIGCRARETPAPRTNHAKRHSARAATPASAVQQGSVFGRLTERSSVLGNCSLRRLYAPRLNFAFARNLCKAGASHVLANIPTNIAPIRRRLLREPHLRPSSVVATYIGGGAAERINYRLSANRIVRDGDRLQRRVTGATW